MEESTESFIVWLLISGAVVSIILYPLGLIAIALMLIPFLVYQIMKKEERLARVNRKNEKVVGTSNEGCIVELALETCY